MIPRCIPVLFMAVVAIAPSVTAAEVSIAISSNRAYVGMPITLQVQVSNADLGDAPQVPDVDGLSIEAVGRPSISSQTMSFNGRSTSTTSTVVYQYQVTALREGDFTIPPIKVKVGGLSTITEAVRFSAVKSETGDAMFVEIVGKRDSVYVGQSIDLTLKIWVLPYENEEYGVTLGEREMWQSFSGKSSWGPFEETLREMGANRRRPAGRSVQRKDASGKNREYFLYEIEAPVYPTRPGKIDADDVRIVMNYPSEIGRSRDPFDEMLEGVGSPFRGSMFGDDFFRSAAARLRVTAVRPIDVEAVVESIEVKPIPTQGRPDDYVGAVGKYSIDVEADSTEVNVGDPITLTLAIRGTGPMDLLLPPKLATQPSLVDGFKVSDEELAGFVDGQRKLFQTTIRPKDESVSEIPPITYSYFDPDTESFVTVTTDPIPIRVSPSDMLKLDSTVTQRAGAARRDPVVSNTNPLAEPTRRTTLFSSDDALVRRTRHRGITSWVIGAFAVPPAVFVLLLVYRSRSRFGFLTSPKRQFTKAVESAASATEVADALGQWIGHRVGARNGSRSLDHVVGQLRQSGQTDVAVRAERFFANVTRSEQEFSRVTDDERLAGFKKLAREIAADIRPSSRTIVGSRRPATVAGLVLLFVGGFVNSGVSVAGEAVAMSAESQATLFRDAVRRYEVALTTTPKTDAETLFAEVADDFQAIADSGVQNDQLYFNVATAAAQAGQNGRAIASYRRSLRIEPENPIYYDQLRIAESKRSDPSSSVRRVNDFVLGFVSPRTMKWLAVFGWVVAWVLFAVAVLRRPGDSIKRASVSMGFVLVFMSVLASTSYAARVVPLVRTDVGVLVGSQIPLRAGDGDEFPLALDIADGDGEVVSIIDRRGGWTNVQRKDGSTGWVKNESVN
ncbi:hypothetical protein Poly51_50250 [Rubripirellula tenax]|uniref:Uncharacterized protein n=1 Tax=Rubripirellula tenax TaxID=2528015 RepID=A0A5C6EHX2_9BACT|nr:BatD family protein [Rubripirellula tenax]TWU47226.1 hypothetical protein Poly51_50250 [Rubripirellula tenax]